MLVDTAPGREDDSIMPDPGARYAADADAAARMPGLPGGIARAVAGHAGWHGAGGEAGQRAPRIAQISWGCMEVEDLGAGKDVSAAVDRIRQH